MHECGGVQHLHHGAQANARQATAAAGLGGHQQQQRTNALAAPGDQVGGDIGHHRDGRIGLPAELGLDRRQILPEQVEDLGCRRDGKSTHPLLRVAGRSIGSPDGRSPCSASFVQSTLVRPEVRKLEFKAKILAAQHGHDLLQRVAVLAGNPDGVALDGGLRLLL